MRIYNIALFMPDFNANWVRRGPSILSFNPKVSIQGQIYRHIGGFISVAQPGPAFLLVYPFDMNYRPQE